MQFLLPTEHAVGERGGVAHHFKMMRFTAMDNKNYCQCSVETLQRGRRKLSFLEESTDARKDCFLLSIVAVSGLGAAYGAVFVTGRARSRLTRGCRKSLRGEAERVCAPGGTAYKV